MQQQKLLIFNLAQHVSGNSLPIFRSARLNYSMWFNAPRLFSVGGVDCRSTDYVFGVRDVARLKLRWQYMDDLGYEHSLRICNTYCFSTTTMVMRTRLNVTVYVLCLSYFVFP